MHLEPYTTLSWAYQLHYYLCFRTYRRRTFFAEESQRKAFDASVQDICEHHDYHLLRAKAFPNHMRCLLSLQPQHRIADVVRVVKTNLSKLYHERFSTESNLWARGYLARGAGRVHISSVRRYLNQQSEHHSYNKRVRPPVFRYRTSEPIKLISSHASFELSHHLVFATVCRAGVFDSETGQSLCLYWLKVGARHGFAIDQVSVLPDHVHLIVRIIPKMSIEECALSLLNNGQHFIGKHFSDALIKAGVDRLWQPSAYAGTCGKITTALLKSFLEAGP